MFIVISYSSRFCAKKKIILWISGEMMHYSALEEICVRELRKKLLFAKINDSNI